MEETDRVVGLLRDKFDRMCPKCGKYLKTVYINMIEYKYDRV